MSPNASPQLILLSPGEFLFAEGDTILQTTLGSCVAITFWDPRRRFGAMCHYILPVRPASSDHRKPGCYADETIQAIWMRFRNLGVQPESLEVRMFGGGNMFPSLPPVRRPLIGERNIEAGQQLLKAHGFCVQQMDLAGDVHRRITFEIQTGRVRVELGDKLESARGVKT